MMEKRRVVFAAFRHRKAGKKSFSGFYSEKRERISEARKLAHPFFLYFWGQKYQKPPHVVLRGSADLWCRHGRQRINKDKYVSVTCALFFTPQGDPRLGSDSERADGGLKARAAGTVCLQTRAVARRRFQTSGRRYRNRSGGFCCFSPPKSREKEKVFSCTFGAKSTKSLRTSFSAGLREPRRCTGRARSSLCATPRRTRRSPHPLFPRQTRVRIDCAANGGIDYLYMAMRSGILFTRKAIPDLVPMAEKRPEG